MNVQNTEAWNVFRERSEQGVSAVRSILVHRTPNRLLRNTRRLGDHNTLFNAWSTYIIWHRVHRAPGRAVA